MDYIENTASLFLEQHKPTPKLLEKKMDCLDVILCTISADDIELSAVELPSFLQCSFFECGCKFLLTDGKRTWEGEMVESDMNKHTSELKQDTNEYLSQTKTAFKREDNMTFKLHRKSKSLGLTWQKQLENESAFVLGNVDMKQAETTAVDFLESVFKIATKFQEDKRVIKNNHQEIITQNERLQAELKQCAIDKKEMEYTLLNKFVKVLNEKKERIRDLEKKINPTSTVKTNSPEASSEKAVSQKVKQTSKQQKSMAKRSKIPKILDDSEAFQEEIPKKIQKFKPSVQYSSEESTTDCEDTVPNASQMLDDL